MARLPPQARVDNEGFSTNMESGLENAQAGSPVLVELRQLVVGYGGRAILPAVSLEVRAEEVWAIVGRNGSGKTTMLRTLLGMLPQIGGEELLSPGVHIGYVPQRVQLDLSVPSRVMDLVMDGLDQRLSFLNPFHVRQSRQIVEQALEDTHTLELARAQISSLSVGQLQRVLLARSLVSRPQVLVLDEPTSAMDMVAERAVFELIDECRRKHHLAVIIVCHDLSLVAEYASRVLFVDKDEGIAQVGPLAEIVRSPSFIRRYGKAPLAELENRANPQG